MTFAGDKASGVLPTLLPLPPGSAEDRLWRRAAEQQVRRGEKRLRSGWID